jgi:hypothetical protein
MSTAAVSASPVVLDSEQKAAAGLATALFKADVPRSTTASADAIADYVDTTLRSVRPAMTPAELLAAPNGITANCAVSGSFKARMADTLPRVLHVNFKDCTTLWFGIERFLDGPIVMTLPADTFQPEHVSDVRLGNDSAEFLEFMHSESPEQNSDDTFAFRMVLRGDLALWYATERTSTFVLNGYYDQRRQVEFPPGTPAQFYDFKTVADHLSVVLTRTTSESGLLDEDVHLLERGSVTLENTQPPPWGSWTDAYSFNDLRVTGGPADAGQRHAHEREGARCRDHVPEA